MKIQNRQYFILGGVEILLAVAIIFVGIQIHKQISKTKIMGTTISSNTLVYDTSRYAYFFEPRPDIKITISPEWLGKTITYTHNKDGFNERFDYSVDKPKDTYRILSIGSSFTYGQYVNTSENYSELLEDLLNTKLSCPSYSHFEVINLGAQAYDIAYTAEHFRKRGVKYSPDLVIWLLETGNFERINEYILPIENELAKQNIPEYDEKSGKYVKNLKAIAMSREKYGDDGIFSYQNNALSDINKYYKGNLLFVSFPSLERNYKNLIGSFSKSRDGISYRDTLTDIPSIDRYHFLDGHPTKEGHKKIAEDIFSMLQKDVLKDCIPILLRSRFNRERIRWVDTEKTNYNLKFF